jgi:hypothetical protein
LYDTLNLSVVYTKRPLAFPHHVLRESVLPQQMAGDERALQLILDVRPDRVSDECRVSRHFAEIIAKFFSTNSSRAGTDVMIFKIFSPKNSAKKNGVF